MANKYKLSDNAYSIRLALMKSMNTPKVLRQMANSLKYDVATLNHHIKALVTEGYVKQETLIVDGKERITYLTIKPEYIHYLEKKVDEIKETTRQTVNPHAVTVRLQDKYHWTPKAKQHIEVRRGSTLSTMTF